MPGKGCKKHTPIVNRAQQKFFGAELSKKRTGKGRKTTMSEEVLVSHLQESKGKFKNAAKKKKKV